MAKGKLIEQLDDAVEAIVSKPNAPLPNSDPRLGAILRIAGELRDLPRADFRNRLKAELIEQSKLESPSQATAAGGKPLITHEDIEQRLKELEEQPDFIVHDVRAALSDLPDMTMRFLDSMNEHLLVASGGRRRSHWERHHGSDEMIYVMEGETEVVTLTDRRPGEGYRSCGVVVRLPRGIVASPDPAAVRVGVLPDSQPHRRQVREAKGAGAQAQRLARSGSRDAAGA